MTSTDPITRRASARSWLNDYVESLNASYYSHLAKIQPTAGGHRPPPVLQMTLDDLWSTYERAMRSYGLILGCTLIPLILEVPGPSEQPGGMEARRKIGSWDFWKKCLLLPVPDNQPRNDEDQGVSCVVQAWKFEGLNGTASTYLMSDFDVIILLKNTVFQVNFFTVWF